MAVAQTFATVATRSHRTPCRKPM